MSTQLLHSEVKHDKQALATVLRFLKTQNLTETEETLRRELGSATGRTFPGVLQSSQTQPEQVDVAYNKLLDFVETSLDMYRHELAVLLYPIFVHLYLELITAGHTEHGNAFFAKYHSKQETFYSDELTRLKSITSPQQMINNDLVEIYRRVKFTTRMSHDSLQSFNKHLQTNQHRVILDIISKYVDIDVFDGTPRPQLDINKTLGSMTGEASMKVNKVKVLYGIPRDPDVLMAMAQLEKEESEAATAEDDKPKKKKPKKDVLTSKKGKATNTPHAPPLNRVPVPPLRDNEQRMKFRAFKDAANCITLSKDTLPSICFYTLLNTFNNLTALTISQDSTLLAVGSGDSAIRLWSLTPKKLHTLKSVDQMQHITLSSEDVMERIVDTTVANDVKLLTGHSGPVYTISFSGDNTLLLSGSEDGTIRLWSLQTYTSLVCFKGHQYPVWSVEFSPLGYYFASSSFDRTARIWNTENVQPLRILAGHSSDVDCCKFHPNGNYLATGSTDRSVRLWDITNGHCCRLYTGHKGSVYALAFSYDGKFLASAGVDKRIYIWDIESGSQVCDLSGHHDTIYQLAFSRDSNVLASGGLDNCVKLWDTSRLNEERDKIGQECLLGSYPTKCTAIHCLHFTRKNLLIAAGPYNS